MKINQLTRLRRMVYGHYSQIACLLAIIPAAVLIATWYSDSRFVYWVTLSICFPLLVVMRGNQILRLRKEKLSQSLSTVETGRAGNAEQE